MMIVIATTGTGGDLFPGIAVAEALKRAGEGEILFAVSGIGPEEEVLSRHGFPFERIRIGRLRGQKRLKQLKTVLTLPSVLWDVAQLLRRFRVGLVFGSGGYSAGPVILAAFFLKLPRAILEPNAIPGLANRLMAPLAQRIYAGFPGMERFFPRSRLLQSGVPVRASLRQVREKTSGPFTLLVFGGSQGAVSINRALLALHPFLKKEGIRVIHQTGPGDFMPVKRRYVEMGGTEVEVVPFIHQMKEAYERSDLVLCRAGASTISELIAVRRPAIIIPYPHSVNHHQEVNARRLADTGSAWVISDREIVSESGQKTLLEKILFLQRRREAMQAMAVQLGRLDTGDPAEVIAEDLLRLRKAA